MATVRKTNLCVFPTDDGASEPGEVDVEIKLKLIGPGRRHTSNVDDGGFHLIETKDSGDVFTCSYCESETCERGLGGTVRL
jgi:hypothetical protein